MLRQLGVALSPPGSGLSPALLRDLVAATSDSGFDSLWTLDNPLADQAEPLTFLANVAARSESLVVGTAAIVAPVRDPVLLAKQLATLDRLTGGHRVVVGLAIGRRPDEYATIGHDFHRRGRLLDDVVAVLRQCWKGAPLDVTGAAQSWKSSGAVGVAPVTPGGPPLLLGGIVEPALRRAVEQGDGYLGSATAGPERAVEALTRVEELLQETDRGTNTFRRVTNVFVQTASSREAALERATAVFTDRHHGQAPPWDPADVVVGGDAKEIADGVSVLVSAGYDGVTLVPVDGSVEQVVALRPAVEAVRSAVPSAACVH